ncbi:MAG: 50S ribosomal protein L32e [Candidatus Altiarchaeales archaeon]|nr:50S ribosomal protein L32e [Candidatus Altiarchaeales archaeon]MBD3415793.1 50S ribosomal protein L32e [Candidatus Altiarchaeales archaeon]
MKYLPKADAGEPAKKKPKFNRQELPRLPRVKDKWRHPRGIDSKKIESKRGKGALPSIGYKKPKAVSGLQYGFRPVQVHNLDGLKDINPDVEAAVIASCVGRKKRNMIIEEANKLKITILNPRRGEA